MESAIGETLIKFADAGEEAVAEYQAAYEAARKDGSDLPAHPSHVEVKTASLDRTQYCAVLFTAEYAPPCQDFLAPFTEFVTAMNAENKRMQVVVVNCDKRFKEYSQCVAKMPEDWLAVPFTAQDTMVGLEDLAQACNLPKVAVFDAGAGYDQFASKDIKHIIRRNESMEQAVSDVIASL